MDAMSENIVIRKISSTPDKRRFVRMLWDIYREDPNWVPPLEMDRMKLIDEKKNPFYAHADTGWWLAERDGEVVGRIAAIVNHNYNEAQHERAGFFGFFESINDTNVARSLFQTAETWLREKGMNVAYGPANPSSNDEYGLLIEGFDRPPVLLMTYNPPYYAPLIEQNGYTKEQDLYAYLLSQETARSEKLVRVSKAMAARNKITVRAMNTKQFKQEVERIKYIYNNAWENRRIRSIHQRGNGFPRRRSKANIRSGISALCRSGWQNRRVCALASRRESIVPRRNANTEGYR